MMNIFLKKIVQNDKFLCILFFFVHDKLVNLVVHGFQIVVSSSSSSSIYLYGELFKEYQSVYYVNNTSDVDQSNTIY